MPMKKLHLRKLALAACAALTTVLAASVFLWGVEYKCSLYPTPFRALHSVPVAKLLSERERPRQASTTPHSKPRLASATTYLLWLWLFAIVKPQRRRASLQCQPLPPQSPADGLRASCLTYFSFRPPPLSLS